MYGIVKVGQLKSYNHPMYRIKIDNKITAVVILTGIITAVLFFRTSYAKKECSITNGLCKFYQTHDIMNIGIF